MERSGIASCISPKREAPPSIARSIAALTVHVKNGFFAQAGGYEFNLALAGMALTLLLAGAGAFSLDGALSAPTLESTLAILL